MNKKFHIQKLKEKRRGNRKLSASQEQPSGRAEPAEGGSLRKADTSEEGDKPKRKVTKKKVTKKRS